MLARLEQWSSLATLVAGVATLALDLVLLARPQAGMEVSPATWAFYGIVVVTLVAIVLGATRHAAGRSIGALLIVWIGIGFLVDLTFLSALLLLPATVLALICGLAGMARSFVAPSPEQQRNVQSR